MVSAGRHEHLRLVGQPAERLAVDDPVAIALKWGPQRAVLLGSRRAAPGRTARPAARAGTAPARPSLCERVGHRLLLLGDAHLSILTPPAPSAGEPGPDAPALDESCFRRLGRGAIRCARCPCSRDAGATTSPGPCRRPAPSAPVPEGSARRPRRSAGRPPARGSRRRRGNRATAAPVVRVDHDPWKTSFSAASTRSDRPHLLAVAGDHPHTLSTSW